MKFSFHKKPKPNKPGKPQTLNFVHSNVNWKQIKDVTVVTAKFYSKFSKKTNKTIAETAI